MPSLINQIKRKQSRRLNKHKANHNKPKPTQPNNQNHKKAKDMQSITSNKQNSNKINHNTQSLNQTQKTK